MDTRKQNIEIIKQVNGCELANLAMMIVDEINGHFGVGLPELTGKVCDIFDAGQNRIEEYLEAMVDLAIDRSPRGELIATETYISKMNHD